ncbi:MAG TPA: alpha/beta hydrolase [Gemmatimonadaceae bacterium]|nr:alpha/beta hydrolase [Gemmatimonadaceae bacterium]
MCSTRASSCLVAPIALTLAICVASTDTHAQQAAARPAATTTATWTDPSPHRVRMIAVAPKVTLEVLDWGGSGEPVVFLAGLGNSGHVFDDFAPQFTDRFHVLAITRRGYGASTQPASGYGVARLAADIKAVLDTLHLARVTLVGHSIAGDELTKVGSTYPDRVAKLVYLDAAHDRTGLPALFKDAPIPPPPPMLAADSASPAAARAYMVRATGVLVPEGEARAIGVFGPTGRYLRDVTPDSIGAAIIAGVEHPAYSRITVPALAFYAVADSVQDLVSWYAALDSTGRAAADKVFGVFTPFARAAREQFQREVKQGRVIDLHGAHHYVFISNAAEVAREMRAFLVAP